MLISRTCVFYTTLDDDDSAESQSQLEPQGSDVLNLSKGVHFLRENAYSEHNFGENVEVLESVNF